MLKAPYSLGKSHSKLYSRTQIQERGFEVQEAVAGEVDVGHIQWHCSEEGGGPDVGLLLRLSETSYIWAGEITRDDWENAGPDAAELGDDFGWWIIFYNGPVKTVIARCADQYTAQDMFDHLSAAIRKGEA